MSLLRKRDSCEHRGSSCSSLEKNFGRLSNSPSTQALENFPDTTTTVSNAVDKCRIPFIAQVETAFSYLKTFALIMPDRILASQRILHVVLQIISVANPTFSWEWPPNLQLFLMGSWQLIFSVSRVVSITTPGTVLSGISRCSIQCFILCMISSNLRIAHYHFSEIKGVTKLRITHTHLFGNWEGNWLWFLPKILSGMQSSEVLCWSSPISNVYYCSLNITNTYPQQPLLYVLGTWVFLVRTTLFFSFGGDSIVALPSKLKRHFLCRESTLQRGYIFFLIR